MRLGNNILFNAFRSISSILSEQQRKKAIVILFLSLINALNDILGLSLIAALVAIVAKQDLLDQTEILVQIKESIGYTDNFKFTLLLSVVVLFLTVIKNVISQFIVYIQAKFAFDVSQELSLKQYQYFFRMGYLFIKNVDSGKKTYSAIDVPYQFGNYYLLQLTVFVTEALVSVIIVLGIFIWKADIGLLLIFIMAPSVLIFYAFTKRKMQKFGDERNKLYPRSHFVLLETLTGFADIQLSNTQQRYQDAFGKIRRRINDIDARVVGIYQKLPQKFNEIIMSGGIVIILAAYYWIGGNKENVIILLGSFGIAAFRIVPSLNRMMNALLNVKNLSYVPSELIHLKENLTKFENARQMHISNALELKNISYSYPERKSTLDGINLKIQKGEFVGIVGESGSGKSTLLNVMLRFLIPDSGELTVDGQSIEETNSQSYQKMLAYVQQDVFIKEGTIRENIAFGFDNSEVNEGRILEIVKQTQLESLIAMFPEGLDHLLTEKGENLSGGQKQRIAIARSLYKDSDIFIFDEPTSALDPETEKTISELIAGLTNLHKTIIIVAHRVSTLARADRIVVMENGTISRTISYNELLQHKNEYETE
ncbi:MAG: ATP-binding cassette domain-containing protein [Bacteroidetes bacterium]|nr:ATP-binding cassette domain-containing protein [Bacteroidota bacterium]